LRPLRLRGENASSLLTVANASGSDFPLFSILIPCSSVANASFYCKGHCQVITCLPLRPLRLRGENAFIILFRVIPCSSVANAYSLLTVANASGSDLILPRSIGLVLFVLFIVTVNSRFVAYRAEFKCEDLVKIVFEQFKY